MARKEITSNNGTRLPESAEELIYSHLEAHPPLPHSLVIAAANDILQGKYASEQLMSDAELSEAQKCELRQIMTTGRTARELLILSNMRFVVKIARKYQRSHVPLPDLLQQGMLGLIRAVEKYDHTLDIHLITYAEHWIEQSISRFISQDTTIRIPVYLYDRLAKIRRCEIDDNQNLSFSHVEKQTNSLGLAALSVVDLDKPLPDGNSWEQVLPSSQNEVGSVFRREALELFQEIFEAVLTPREELVIKMLFGLSQYDIHSRSEISKKLDVSPGLVSQCKSSALKKLSQYCSEKGVDIYSLIMDVN